MKEDVIHERTTSRTHIGESIFNVDGGGSLERMMAFLFSFLLLLDHHTIASHQLEIHVSTVLLLSLAAQPLWPPSNMRYRFILYLLLR